MKGCNGGSSPIAAFEYIQTNGGLDTEISYPYTLTGLTEKCRYNRSNIGATVVDIAEVESGSEAALQHAVATQVERVDNTDPFHS